MSSSFPAWAVPGAKCVCVVADDKGGPAKNEICVITETMAGDARHPRLYLYIAGYDGFTWLSETKRKRTAYAAEKFRPLVPLRTKREDVALFTHHLDQRQPERADA